MMPAASRSGVRTPPQATVAAVLPGGGARGAYEIGAMSVLLPELEARGERIAVWCGTSVGAINATLLASLAHRPVPEQIDRAIALWLEMRKQDVIARIVGRGGARTLVRLVGHALGVHGVGLASLLDPSPLAASLDRWIDWTRLARNVQTGVVSAVCTLATGDPVAFASTHGPAPSLLEDGLRYVPIRLRGEHVRASAAIPLLFPTVEITTPRSARGHYIDGGTRLNSPIKPALNLGADRVIVIGLEPFTQAAARPTSPRSPGIADVAANVLDGLLVDHVAYDLRRLAAITRSSSRTQPRARCARHARTGSPAAILPTGRSPTRWSRPAGEERSGASPTQSSNAGSAASAVCVTSTTQSSPGSSAGAYGRGASCCRSCCLIPRSCRS